MLPKTLSPDYRQYVADGPYAQLVAGVDEAGRGPLAGNVVAAAVILDPARPIAGLMDSKQLSAQRREQLYPIIQQQALAYAVGRASAAEIDQINILQASLLAMQRAVAQLSVVPKTVWVDGNHCPQLDMTCYALIKGDSKMPAISAASIIAKVVRDREMLQLDAEFPHYGFAQHKGYPTAQHRHALQQYGPCAAHRRSYAPVKRCMPVP